MARFFATSHTINSTVILRISELSADNLGMDKLKENQEINSCRWGIECLDRATHGIPANNLSVLETPNYHSGLVLLGHFLHEGLKNNEKVVLITFDSAEVFLQNFLEWDFDFKKYLESEQLYLLHYKPDVINQVSLTYSYDSLFEEIQYMCGGEQPARVAIHQIDTLVNLNNPALINNSIQKLALSADAQITSKTTILGQFIQFNDEIHRNLSIAFQKTVAGCFSVKNRDESRPTSYYKFETLKIPWFDYLKRSLEVHLVEGEGLVESTKQSA